MGEQHCELETVEEQASESMYNIKEALLWRIQVLTTEK